MAETTEKCPLCGNEVPIGRQCMLCSNASTTASSTVTDLDISDGLTEAGNLETVDARIPANVYVVIASTGKRHNLKNSHVKIGRSPSNEIVISGDDHISRHHAWITYEEDQFWVADLGSTNGTLLNGKPVQRRESLSSGDKIKVGRTDIVFKWGEN